MTLYAGDTVQLLAVAYDPLLRQYSEDATVQVDVYAPDKDPVNVPADRTTPLVANVGLAWSPAVEVVIAGTKYTGAYVGSVDTANFQPGRYIYRVRASGTVSPNTEYAAFVLK